MRLLASAVLLGAILGGAALDPQGVKCGQKRCTALEYCSRYDEHCRPCSEACDEGSRNHQPEECASDCQVYLHDRRYVLRSELDRYEDLEGQLEKLWILFAVAITLACLSMTATLYLLGRAVLRWERIGRGFRRAFARNWIKTASNNNKVQNDAEIGTVKQNGLKLTMPTISATVAPSRGVLAQNGSVNGTGTGNSTGTPNTTSTPLSRRHPSEDTTLDYAYDNPAMTPSPEAAQLRTKRESSF